ncbi:hypothetical protein R1sor_020291 [Riccia sorocarpa]|uniref:Uncharacterized protein n=1 Tax=Riccia sorocarpa TaxID=122646 RepID=A0ABD3II98_9MARC
MKRQEELTAEAPVEENETPKPPTENVVSGGSPGNVDCEADSPGASSGRRIEVLVMASTDPVDEEARLRAVGGDETAKFRVRLRDDIELQLESATAKLFNAESHIVKALYEGNNELAKREIYDAHGKSQDARCHIRRAMQLVNYVLASEDDTLDGRWKKKFGELEANGEVSAMEIVEYLCKCDETNPPVLGCLVHDDQGKLR